MRLIKRSVRNVFRRSARSILTGIVLVIISVFVLIGLSIKAGTSESIAEAKKKLGSELTLSVNMEKAFEEAREKMNESGTSSSAGPGNFSAMMNIEQLTEETADLIKGSSLLEGYDYLYSGNITATMEAVELDASEFGGRGGNIETNTTDDDGTVWGSFSVIGNRFAELNSDFQNGVKILADDDSRFYTEEEVANGAMVALIDSQIAELNDLKVGDTIKIKKSSMRMRGGPGGQTENQDTSDDEDATVYEVKIIGVFEDAESTDSESMSIGNTVYMPYSSIRKIMLEDTDTDEKTINSAVYYLKNPDDADALKEEAVQAGIDTDKFTLDMDQTAYQQMVGQLQKLSDFANIMIITVFIAGAVIIMLIMTLNARERKAEIGILRALGAKRSKIAIQFIVETVSICLAALVVGTGVGVLTSQKVADVLLERQIAAEESATAQQQEGFGREGFGGIRGGGTQAGRMGGMRAPGAIFSGSTSTSVDEIDSVSAQVGIMQLLELIGLALIISLLGSLSAAYWVMKYEPMNILSNRE